MAGKGSAPRPLPDYDKYSDNWDSIFNKKPDYTIRVRKLDDSEEAAEDFAYEASVEEMPDLIVYEESYKEAYEVIVDLIRVTEEALAERE